MTTKIPAELSSTPGISDSSDATAITITSAEKVGIGTANPSQLLTVESNSFPILQISNTLANNPTDGAALDIVEKQDGFAASTATFGQTGVYGYRLKLNGSTNELILQSGSQTTTTDRVTVERDTGNVTLDTGNLVIGTSGKGIDFSATADPAVTGATSTSELLDNYEEGTWTPVYQSTTNSSNNVTNSRVGYYTRIGNTVYITANLTSNDVSGITSTDQVVIGGLPYASSSTTSGNDQAVNVAQYRFLLTTDHTLLIQNNSSDIRVTTDGFSAATYATFFQYSNSTSTSLKISAVYQV